MDMRTCAAFGFILFASYIVGGAMGNTNVHRARDVTWSSHNFKTLLTWGPKPTDYSYTVEFYGVGKDRERTRHCIRSKETECDLTGSLLNLKDTYYADVLLEPEMGASDLVEFPHSTSQKFCPYTDTLIGRPDFKYEVDKARNKITLFIQDPLSAISKDDRMLNMRDIFKDDLKYKVTYHRARSTGKKTKTTATNEIEFDAEDGDSYCFTVQAYIPSRSRRMQLGEMSLPQCSPSQRPKTILDEFGLGVIAGGLLMVVVVAISVISLIVVCCRRRRASAGSGKDAEPLNLA
ncbi:hypothetical protein JZ751_014293 [Albula glossodonta]|uniref:Tissue factor n=1 Tax=Albula glossodonta TaxID=121402 RepID=A0A8T2P0Y9_9TELE|nr:hypothetical protein JZ751_014293 [Albula glossodonta]